MDWPTQRVENWVEFTNIVDRLMLCTSSPETAYIFRGQANSEWGLLPSLARTLPNLTADQLVNIESQLLEEFQVYASGSIPTHYLTHSDDIVAWWCLMQHYRAPTRVLDWTNSPYVAAYFAVESLWSLDACIWIIHAQQLDKNMNTMHPGFDVLNKRTHKFLHKRNAPPHLSHFRMLVSTERMIVQQGYFTICCQPNRDHAELISECLQNDDRKVRLLKILIPHKLKADFLLRLRSMNIASNSLFPGIDGVGRSIFELARLHGVYSPSQKGQQSVTGLGEKLTNTDIAPERFSSPVAHDRPLKSSTALPASSSRRNTKN